jgi:hypothetical protein
MRCLALLAVERELSAMTIGLAESIGRRAQLFEHSRQLIESEASRLSTLHGEWIGQAYRRGAQDAQREIDGWARGFPNDGFRCNVR